MKKMTKDQAERLLKRVIRNHNAKPRRIVLERGTATLSASAVEMLEQLGRKVRIVNANFKGAIEANFLRTHKGAIRPCYPR